MITRHPCPPYDQVPPPTLDQMAICHVRQIACSRDGTTLVVATSNGLLFCDSTTLEPRAAYLVGISAFCFLSDDSAVIAACGRALLLVRMADAQVLSTIATVAERVAMGC